MGHMVMPEKITADTLFMQTSKSESRLSLSTAQRLGKMPLFVDFDPYELEEVALLVSEHECSKNEVVFREGDKIRALFLIFSGAVCSYRLTADGKETILSLFTEKEFFGEMNLMSDTPQTTNVRAMTTGTHLAWIDYQDFAPILERSPRIARMIIEVLTQRLNGVNLNISGTFSLDIKARLANLLLNLSVKFGEKTPEGIRIHIRFTNAELASMIGTTRETINRTLNRFWDEHIIDMKTSNIIILDPVRLAESLNTP